MSRFQCFQVVTQAQTISAIQKHYGGALGSLKDDCISKWLEENRPGSFLFRLECCACFDYCAAHVSAAAVADSFLSSLAG
jgi:hypothetical protein